MEINYHLPSFTTHYSLNLLMIDYMKKHPEYFRDGIKIASVFGCFDGSAWNGGRNVSGKYDPEMNRRILQEYNSRGIPLRFTFTNPHITERHLSDKACNDIMKMADNGMNQVIVMSPILEEYIRENYPNYKITSSTCKEIRDMNGLNAELDKDYNLVVLDYNWNNRFDELALIKDKSRCEILVNACCQPACPRRGEHYSTIGKYQIELSAVNQNSLGISGQNIVKDPFPCPYMSYDIYQIQEHSTYISPDDIESKYVPMGFSQFKLEGRNTRDIDVLEMYIHYFTKEEHERQARLDLLKNLTGAITYFNILQK
ncbi:MAG: hypothetical protein J1F11_04025 [Oscillospiraceae bacterium]|nr:hypothetical protein [Oscillospiraceae bacterium]